MGEKYDALMKNHTSTLTPPPLDSVIIGSRWVYAIKKVPDGSIKKYKASLVAKGCHQQHGIDFDKIFSPVIQPTTIRTVLTLALSNGWCLRQFYFNNAFLNGDITETVYMT
ncbi:uncharacterized mitochondrial protein AtMg00820-like [Arachis stenosperma]|uniref:uncharacterized mitochondrial protein AtMg00820-like n=1 Tax=Arachis stenosperma TaxID=217475 RepID=UPI0025ABBDA5|nr:uncharacterized mitochondrial protein AtMg00820-like [Arachis stenosperma]